LAQRYRSTGIRGQVVVKLKGKRDSNRMDFGHDGITPRQGGIHLNRDATQIVQACFGRTRVSTAGFFYNVGGDERLHASTDARSTKWT
jgi:hypothetical protein